MRTLVDDNTQCHRLRHMDIHVLLDHFLYAVPHFYEKPNLLTKEAAMKLKQMPNIANVMEKSTFHNIEVPNFSVATTVAILWIKFSPNKRFQSIYYFVTESSMLDLVKMVVVCLVMFR